MLYYVRKWIGRLDIFIWIAVLIFFLSFSFVKERGDFMMTVVASLGVILVMLFVGISIEVIIDVLRNVRGLGTILGFLTNGPETVVLIAGVMAGDALFGSSTPLGSSVINPIMLFAAALVTGMTIKLLKAKSIYGMLCIIFTIGVSLLFYLLPEKNYLTWALVALFITSFFFLVRPREQKKRDDPSDTPFWFIVPATALLFIAGYYLDPAVEFARQVSGVPKNLIGFLVLATLSSFPEFKSCLVLFREGQVKSASINIFVSNITNIWLAIIGVVIYLLI